MNQTGSWGNDVSETKLHANYTAAATGHRLMRLVLGLHSSSNLQVSGPESNVAESAV